MGFDLNEITLDEKRASEGQWFDFMGGSKLKIASTDSRRYRAALAKEAKKHRIELDDSNPENFDAVMKVTMKVQAENVLLDWKGVDFQGQESVPYTPELGMLALDASPPLRAFVQEKAGLVDNYKLEVIGEAKKP